MNGLGRHLRNWTSGARPYKPATSIVPEIQFKIGKIELGPHDILVVKSAYYIDREVVERIKLQIGNDANISNKIMVIGPDIDLAVLKRTEIEEKTA
jgi:hypothetical protein